LHRWFPSPRRARIALVAGLLGLLVPPRFALAADPGERSGCWVGLWQRSNLLGDVCGLRSWLGTFGLGLNLQEQSEVLGNISGGIRRGARYEGLTTASLTLDTSKRLDWEGGTFTVSALQIHGRNLSQELLANLQTASGIEANRATRLWELWYQQAFLDGAVDLKVGQQSLDQEFIVSKYANAFVNTMFGWPMLPSADLYSGGPAYPLASPGVRLRAQPNGALTLLAGVFDDNPGGGAFNANGQITDASGAKFSLRTGALWIAEAQYALNQPAAGEVTHQGESAGLPGTYRLGVWYDTGRFPDQRFDTNGLSLANPLSNGIVRLHRHSYSIYAVMDQLVWRPDETSARGIGVFARLMGAPGDRNLIDFSANLGLTFKGLLPGRDNDTAGIGFGLAKVSGRASDLDRDQRNFTGTPVPIRSTEEIVELTYQYQVTPWWQLQPDFQYVFNPGAGIVNPSNPAVRLKDEAIMGLRTTITF
jgi:porin